MYELLLNHRRTIVAAVLVLIPLLFLGGRLSADVGQGSTSPIATYARQPILAAQGATAGVVGHAAGYVSGIFSASLAQENEHLRQENARLR
ncbi:MAG: hypothetical protein AAGI01_18000, partial [Myxococcota bacterium]